MRPVAPQLVTFCLAAGLISTFAVPAAFAAPPKAPDPTFSTSFESDEPQPDWTDTPEDVDGHPDSEGIVGLPYDGLPGSVNDRIDEVRASAENAPSEGAAQLVDGSTASKWLAFESTGWVEIHLSEPAAVKKYALTSANDAPERDPKNWTIQGSQDGSNWTTIDTRTDQDFAERDQTVQYDIADAQEWSWYRIEVTANSGADIVQLAEWQLADGSPAPEVPDNMMTALGKGPTTGHTAKPGVGWTGTRALRYAGRHTTEGPAHGTNKVLDVDIDVTADTELSYLIFPEFVEGDVTYPSTHVAVDLAFTDGTRLSELAAVDHHGYRLTPRAQGAANALWPDQWNHVRSRIGDVAAGRTIDRILIGYDHAEGPTQFSGWLDDLTIGVLPSVPADTAPSERVLTTRGTNSSGGFSRGNNLPATAMPHGFNFFTPMTDAGSISWPYEYHRRNTAENRPALEGFGVSHQPSPWMGDRQTFGVMGVDHEPSQDRTDRALSFGHDAEVARPHVYDVRFDNGMRTEITPTDHAAMFRFTFTGDESWIAFDNIDNNGGLQLDQESGTVTGFSDVRSGNSQGATRLFVYGRFDQSVSEVAKPGGGERPDVFGHAKFDTSTDRTVTLRLATSLISIDQAKHNLDLEIAADDTFEKLQDRAQSAWDKALGVIKVEGASDDQLTTLYSNLYRLNLYPNSGHENVGTADAPKWKHAVQSSAENVPSSPTETGAPVVDGKVYVNNGFWDTYRTAWAAYGLYAPQQAGELVDGFVQQYRDGGWISRWSSPGYANLMTGTSSDVAFADLYVKGIKGIDPRDTYDAGLRNATVAPPGSNPDNTNVGRKGNHRAPFLGWTPSSVPEGVSWGLEGGINDYGLANQARMMATDPRTPESDRQRYREEAAYFLERSRIYRNTFDPKINFFQGRAADGTFKTAPDAYDPRVWGNEHDYTETNGWNFAFHVPHDGAGLATLYGGRQGLADKLDTFFATPETGEFPGSYGGVIHEVREARDWRMGQWGFSNQVSHHIPWMYLYAGQPHKTQQIVRETLQRGYVGSEIGQGYAGDEDNGEQSAWYLLAALGLYPLQVGSGNYVIGSPLFTKATLDLGDGKKLVVNAPQNSTENVYVQNLRVNGRVHPDTWISHEQLADGAVLDFEMGPKPSRWGTRAAAPPSVSEPNTDRPAIADVTGPGRGTSAGVGADDVSAAFDDNSRTEVSLSGDDRSLTWKGSDTATADFYTVTSGAEDGADPTAWKLQGSNDGKAWTTIDERNEQQFSWRRQTRPFQLAEAVSYKSYRLVFTGSQTATTVSEVEFLASSAVDTAEPRTTRKTPAYTPPTSPAPDRRNSPGPSNDATPDPQVSTPPR
ncbi:GH92 family glycosyl hydrolase [Propionibacteriaceae bacterium Y1700]|uniref:GH92 family glycosyl hydrolase n=1 Tax=Microlunatus sp. Y1700 TaxID=3418487 RepID=UPI003DA72E08